MFSVRWTAVDMIGLRVSRTTKFPNRAASAIEGKRHTCNAGTGQSIEPPNVAQLAQMAHLAVTNDEVRALSEHVTSI
jgi:hypothetical protein